MIVPLHGPNDGTRTLTQSIMLPTIVRALLDWTRGANDCILIGGLALSYYVKPRMTQDIDVLFTSDSEIPRIVPRFKKTNDHVFQHGRNRVVVEIVTPEHVGEPKVVFERVRDTAVVSDGVKIASRSGQVALKLFRANAQDRADIVALIKTGTVDLTSFPLSPDRLAIYERLVEEAKTDPS